MKELIKSVQKKENRTEASKTSAKRASRKTTGARRARYSSRVNYEGPYGCVTGPVSYNHV